MFNKIYDWFDNSLDYGFHKVTTKKQTVNPDSAQFVMAQALDVWNLWVKQPVTFVLTSTINNRETGTASHAFHSAVVEAREIYDCSDEAKEAFMREPDAPLCSNIVQNRESMVKLVAKRISEEGSIPSKELKGYAEQVHIPYSIMSEAEDFASAIDCVTAAGLEALEFNNSTLLKLTRRCVQALVDNTHSVVGPDYDHTRFSTIKNLAQLSINLPNDAHYELHCRMFKQVWSALCTQQHRNTILDKWPGWSDLFVCLDQTYLDSCTTLQKFVDGKAFGNSEYERFLTAVCYNVCTPDKKVKLPKPPQFEMAASVVRRYWPSLLQDTPDNQIINLGKMLTEIRGILSLDVDANKSVRKGAVRCGRDQIQDYEAKSRVSQEIMAEPSKDFDNQADEGGLQNSNISSFYITMDEAMKLNWKSRPFNVQTGHHAPPFESPLLVDAVSAASWRVSLPPPTDHGQSSGMLDEGALHKLAGWGDHHVFDQPPEKGAGSIVLAVLMDTSGSMASLMGDARTFLHAIMEGCKRHPNVKIIPIAYNSAGDFTLKNEGGQSTISCMVELTNSSQLTHIWSHGGTPTGLVIKDAIRRLDMESVGASKGIIVVTDGRPCGRSCNPGEPIITPETGWPDAKAGLAALREKTWHDTPEVVLSVCRNSPYPVVGVGIGAGITRVDMVESFGAYSSFNVESADKVVPIVCDILDSATM